jgi:hypothetical protein
MKIEIAPDDLLGISAIVVAVVAILLVCFGSRS